MVAPLAAVKAGTVVGSKAASKMPKPTSDNAMGYLIAGVVGIWLLKSAADKVLDPIGDVAGFVGDVASDVGSAIATGTGKVVWVGDELTGTWQRDPRKLSTWTTATIPFTEKEIPLVNLKEQDESWMDYATTVDLPGLPEYNFQDAPGQIKGLFGRIF